MTENESLYLINKSIKALKEAKERYAELIQYVKENNISRAVLARHFMEAGLTRVSAKIEAHRIHRIINKKSDPENIVQLPK